MCKRGTCACPGIPVIDTEDPVYLVKGRFWSNGITDISDEMIVRILKIQQDLRTVTGSQSVDLVGFVIGEMINAKGWVLSDLEGCG